MANAFSVFIFALVAVPNTCSLFHSYLRTCACRASFFLMSVWGVAAAACDINHTVQSPRLGPGLLVLVQCLNLQSGLCYLPARLPWTVLVLSLMACYWVLHRLDRRLLT